jgi:hypothetical protein
VAKPLRAFHILSSIAIGLAVPLVIYLVNGTIEPWTFILGAVIGFGYWYWGPWLPPF